MLNLTRLRYFLAIADTLSFREAANRLNIAQPAVTRALQLLEDELDLVLVERTTRSVQLTPAGAALHAEARDVFEALDRALRHARQIARGSSGELLVGYSSSSAHLEMAEIIVQFRAANPDSNIRLTPMASHEQASAIENGELDLGFVVAAACRPPLQVLHLKRDPLVLLVSRYHRLAKASSVRLDMLRDEAFVAGNERWKMFHAVVNACCLSAGFLPRIVEEADDPMVLMQLVTLQKGIMVYGASAARLLSSHIVAVPIEDEMACFELGLAWDPRRETPLMRSFLQLAGKVPPAS